MLRLRISGTTRKIVSSPVLVPVHKIPKAFSISVFCVEGRVWNFALGPTNDRDRMRKFLAPCFDATQTLT
jgi:hypothetical protein